MEKLKKNNGLIYGGLGFSIVWVGFLLLWAAVADSGNPESTEELSSKLFSSVRSLTLNEFGDFLAGGFAVLAFFWLALAVLLQRQELIAQREELMETRKALQAQAEESKRSADFLKTQNDILQDQYNLQSLLAKQREAEGIVNIVLDHLKFNVPYLLRGLMVAKAAAAQDPDPCYRSGRHRLHLRRQLGWYVQGWEKGQRSFNAGLVHVTGTPIQYLNAEGVVVSRDLHLGPLAEPIAIYFQDSKVTRVEGGGEFGDYVRSELDRLKDKVFMTTKGYGVPGARPLKGAGWLEETAFMTHPKWIRVPDYGKAGRQNSFSTAFNNWVGMGRSGVFHVAIGMSESTAWGPAQMPSTERDWHIDFVNYFTTLTIGDTVLIKDGRLVVLDDPEIREVASRYGDPDELLREDSIPAVPGVNVP